MKINIVYKLVLVCFVFLNMISIVKGDIAVSFKESRDTTVYTIVDKQAVFDGNLYAWFGENVSFLQNLPDSLTNRKMVISFVVEPDGSVSTLRILRSIHPLLDEEIGRLFKKMPQWNPAELNGHNVRALVSIPLTFKFEGKKVPKQISFDEFLEQLESAAQQESVPLDQVRLEEGIKRMRSRFGSDREAFNKVKGFLDVDDKHYNAMLKMFDPNHKEDFAEQIKEIDTEAKKEGKRLIEELGEKDFIRKFVAVSPEFERLALKKILKIRDILTPAQFETYYDNKSLAVVVDGCGGCCSFFHTLPVHRVGNIENGFYRLVKYPLYAQEHSIQGKVSILIMVNADGEMDGPVVLSAADEILNREALRVMASTREEWIPGFCLIHQKPTSESIVIPITFTLKTR